MQTISVKQLADKQRQSDVDAIDLRMPIEYREVHLINVRSDEEWKAGHIEQAEHHFLGHSRTNLEKLPRDETLIVHCQSIARSSIGVRVLQGTGHKNVINLTDGYAYVPVGN